MYTHSVLFWSDWGTNAKIERIYMDGSNRIVIHSRHLIWPNALTIDIPTKTLFWADAKHHVIERSNYNGLNHRIVLMEGVGHPFSLSVFEDRLYWSDWGSKAILSTRKCSGINTTTLYSGLFHPMDVQVVHHAKQPMPLGQCDNMYGVCACTSFVI